MAAQRVAERLDGVGVPQPHRLSQLPEAMRLPSGLNATLNTPPVWPVSGWPTGWPVSASHNRTVLSSLPEAIRVPSGLNATRTPRHVTGQRLADGLAGVGVPQPHGAVELPEAMRCPSGLNATLTTSAVWPVSGWPNGWPVSASHTRTVCLAAGGDGVPSGLNATLSTVSVWP